VIKKANVWRWLAVYGVCLAVLLAAYAAELTVPYAAHDQYWFFLEAGEKTSCANSVNYEWLWMIGRPLTAWADCFIFKHTSTIQDLIHVRLGTLAIMALGATGLVRLLSTRGLGLAAALPLALAVYLLPGAQHAAFMGPLAHAVPACAAFAAYASLDACARHWADRRRRAIGWLAVTGLLLGVALFTYPMQAAFFFAGTVATVLLTETIDGRLARSIVLRDILVFSAAAGLYVAAVSVFLRVEYSAKVLAGISVPYRFAIEPHLLTSRVAELLQLYPSILNLWNGVDPTAWFGLVIAGLAVTGGLLTRHGWRRLGLVLVLLVVSHSAYLLTNSIFLYRIFWVPAAFLVLTLGWSVGRIGQWMWRGIPPWLAPAGVLVVALAVAVPMNRQNVDNSWLETQFFQAGIAAHAGETISRVHVVQAVPSPLGYNGRQSVTDEFNSPSADNPTNLVPMVRFALRQLPGFDRYVIEGAHVSTEILQVAPPQAAGPFSPQLLVVTTSEAGEPFTMTPGTVVIDLGLLDARRLLHRD
jgi:hypothetical protein